MRTLHGIEEDALSIIGAFYFPNSVTTEETRHQMYQVLKDCHLEFGRKNQSLEDSKSNPSPHTLPRPANVVEELGGRGTANSRALP